MKTITYSRVESLNIQLDLYLPSSMTEGSLPAVIFIHGGGMIAGSRRDLLFPEWLKDSALGRGFIFISADYRLVYPATGFDQIEDMKSLFSFLSSPDFSASYLPTGISLDANRIAVSGASGGAYAARAAGIYASPKPRAVLSLFGMGGDFLSDHWLAVKGDTAGFLDASSLPSSKLAELLANVQEHISDAPIELRADGAVMDKGERMGLFVNWWKTGEMLDYVLGRPGLSITLRSLPPSDRLAAIPTELLPALLQFQLTNAFPPTRLVHGDLDPVVLPEESRVTFERLKELGVRVELDIVKGTVHGLMAPGTPPKRSAEAEAAQERGMEFLSRELLRD